MTLRYSGPKVYVVGDERRLVHAYVGEAAGFFSVWVCG